MTELNNLARTAQSENELRGYIRLVKDSFLLMKSDGIQLDCLKFIKILKYSIEMLNYAIKLVVFNQDFKLYFKI